MSTEFNAQIDIAPSAIERVYELLQIENDFDLKLRIYIVGGGCSGFQYAFSFEKTSNPNDIVLTKDLPEGSSAKSISFIVDPISINYLQGATLEFVSDLTGSRFKVSNPNAASTCSCGSSFAV